MWNTPTAIYFRAFLQVLERSQQSPAAKVQYHVHSTGFEKLCRAKHRLSGAVSAVCSMVTTEEALDGDPVGGAVSLSRGSGGVATAAQLLIYINNCLQAVADG